MEYIRVKNTDGLELRVSTKVRRFGYLTHIIGGDVGNPDWDEYLMEWKEGTRKYVKMIRTAIELLEWVGYGATKVGEVYFNFSDGTCFIFTDRAWGDLMQSIVGNREGYRAYK